MKPYINRFLSITVLTYIGIFIMSLMLVVYLSSPKFNTKGHCQNYYMKGMNLDLFMQKYKELYSSKSKYGSDFYYFQEPYHGRFLKYKYIDYIDHTYYCYYYIPDIDAQVRFSVAERDCLWISLLSCRYTLNGKKKVQHEEFVINKGNDFNENRKIMNAFESSVLSNIGSFERDDFHGLLCRYDVFFQNHFFVFGSILFALIIIRIVIADRMNKRRWNHGDSK